MGNFQDADSKKSLILSVFKHLAQSVCGVAVAMVWHLSLELEEIKLKKVKLENREGLERVHLCCIKTIPTVKI